MDAQIDSDSKSTPKPPVIRGARACTVCRAAKMKCVGAEDGQKSCQRCKRANAECVFEKHRRGRKPGSKLSEASKVLRRLEKGLHSAKLKSPSADSALASPFQSSDIRVPPPQDISYSGPRSEPGYGPPATHFPTNELPPLNVPAYQNGDAYASSSKGSRSMDMDDDDDPDRNDDDFFPAKLIRRENRRNSFFRTILNPNPEEPPAVAPVTPNRSSSFTPPQIQLAPCSSGLSDPITAGILTEKDAETLFDCIYLRLNPFINLFDPALHTVPYVRSKCPFLFTTLLMAACKFFKTDYFKPCQKLANDFAVRAFAEAWKRVEVVQAFACLTYWKEPDDNRTWTYIGYACRMAVELGLNRYVAHPAPSETQLQRLERRNRERTYLVLFVHDRSLSTQTGRHWMLPEDDLIKHSNTWHMGNGGKNIRPEDVIIAAFVSLRRIAAETTDIFSTSRSAASGVNTDINYEVVLRNCNDKLNQWDETWRTEMERAAGESFHTSFLALFRLYVRLFLNSFGIHASMLPGSRQSPSLGVLSICCTSALDSLKIVSNDFVKLSMLRYGQDSITVMTAYSAVFLLKLLRTSNTYSQLNASTAKEIHDLIATTADSYADIYPPSTSAAYHARFLRSLVENDTFKSRRNHDERERHDGMPIDPRLQGPSSMNGSIHGSPPQIYPHQAQRAHEQSFHFPASPHLPAHPQINMHEGSDLSGRNSIGNGNHLSNGPVQYQGAYPLGTVQHASELDAHYWKNMFIELGFGDNGETNAVVATGGTSDTRTMQQYVEHPHQHHPPAQHQNQNHPHHSQLTYHHHMSHPVPHPNYGH